MLAYSRQAGFSLGHSFIENYPITYIPSTEKILIKGFFTVDAGNPDKGIPTWAIIVLVAIILIVVMTMTGLLFVQY
jgi:hypothetical protein